MLVVMGVSGSGKTTIGRLLAARTGWTFHDADDYHCADDVAKMRRGIPLTDADRIPWLETLHREVVAPSLENGESTILACSALKRSYLQRLGAGDPRVRVIYLQGSYRLVHERMQRRAGHFMGAGMLESQFDALEAPENALVVDASEPPDAIVDKVMQTLGLPRTR